MKQVLHLGQEAVRGAAAAQTVQHEVVRVIYSTATMYGSGAELVGQGNVGPGRSRVQRCVLVWCVSGYGFSKERVTAGLPVITIQHTKHLFRKGDR